jgi:hypothetical protein
MSIRIGKTETEKSRQFAPASSGLLQRKCAYGNQASSGAECEACGKERESALQRKAVDSSKVGEAPPIVYEVLNSPGQPLPAGARAFFEPRFGRDFSNVRIHTGSRATDSARAVNALAYTVGRDVVFGAGKYAPETTEGRRLLAHELTHVAQQAERRGAQVEAATLEQEAFGVAAAIESGHMPSISEGSASLGLPQFDREPDAGHPSANPTPEEYIKGYRSFWGGLQTKKLASDLYLLAWQSASHYPFVLTVYKQLGAGDRTELAQDFFEQLGNDSFIEDFALTPNGRSFLTAIAGLLPAENKQRKRVEAIVFAGPQAEREKERKESIEALKKQGKKIDITIYTSYKGMDTAAALLEPIAKGRERRKATDAAFPMEDFEDIGITLAEIGKQTGVTEFVRELHLMGHGTENKFGFGRYLYNSEYLQKNYETGLHAVYMAPGATIYMEGCDVAKGEAGLKYLKEVGRIFFGDQKAGFVKGNTCIVIGMGEITECQPRTLRWPSDFK